MRSPLSAIFSWLMTACLMTGATLPLTEQSTWAAEKSQVHEADVVIYGGTSAGIAAAVELVRLHKSVVVIEPGQHLGGLTSGGLGWTDSGVKSVIGGIALQMDGSVQPG